jgi:hypothetical protein
MESGYAWYGNRQFYHPSDEAAGTSQGSIPLERVAPDDMK